MTENAFFLLAAGLCLIPLIFLLPFNWKAPAGLLISLVFTVGSSMLAYEAFMHGTQRYIVPDVEPIGSFELRFDKLSVFFMSIVNLSVLAANVYALGYTRNVVHRYVSGLSSVFMCLLHVSMLFLCMVEQLMVFLIAWEIMSLSSFMLILWDHKREEVRDAALDYLVQMHIGVALLTTAVLLLQRDAGTATFDSLHIYFGQHNNLLLFSLFFLGFGFKAGFLGLHTWMPGTYSNAPAHAGAVMASAMKKLAIYGIIRVMLHVQDHQVLIGLSILILSISTTLYGIVNGIMQRNLARMLAYSSMENVGIIGIGLGMTMVGIGTHNNLLIVLGFTGCLFHILNHTLFKNVLFMAAGSVRRRAHTLNMDTLGGLVHGMPKTTALFLVASVAACGLPPLNAFMSEFLLYNGLLKGLSAGNVSVDMILLLAIITLVLAGGLAIYAFTQVGGVTFLGYPRTEQAANAVETDSIMLWPQYILVAIMLSIGLLPGFWFRLIAEVAETALHGTLKITGKYYARAEDIGLAGGLFIVFILVLYIIRSSRVKVNTVRRGDPWACGYLAVNTRMQYTATGFADYFAKLTKAIVGVKQVYKPIPRLEIFPDERKFEIQSYDTVRTNFVSRGGEMLRKALDKAAVIQTGQVQSYILYACIFLVTMFLLTLFNFI